MNIHKSIVTLLLTIFWSALSYGQDCVSFEGPLTLPDRIDTAFILQVYNLDSTDLASNQRVCQVNIHFITEYPEDLQFSILSPIGDEIILTGKLGTESPGPILFASWNISFVPLDSMAFPDGNGEISSTWENRSPWAAFGEYTGSYWPYQGDIDNLRTGDAYGEWKLRVLDINEFHTVTIVSFSIEFCNPSGIDCKECIAEADTINPTIIEYCENDPSKSIEFSDFLRDTTHLDSLAADFRYNAVIVHNDTVIDYRSPLLNDTIFFDGLKPGTYQLYGMAYDTLYKMDVPDADSTFTIDSLRSMIDSLPRIFCGDLTTDALTIIIDPIDTTYINQSICSGDSLVVGGQIFKESINTQVDLTNQFDCDSIIIIDLDVIAIPLTVIDTILCVGDSLEFNGTWYADRTNQPFRFTSASSGCDSTVLLDLKFLPYNFTEINKEICGGDEFIFFGNSLNATGAYRDSLIGSNGCDSVVLLNLNVVTEFVVDTITTLCLGDTFFIDTEKFFSTGSHSHTFPSTLGCDSTVNLNLTIIEPIRNDVSEIICFGDSFLVGIKYYDQTGEYIDTLSSAIGCDSIVLLDLEVLTIPLTVIDTTICHGDSLEFNGVWYNERVNQPFTFTSTNQGCDSTILLDLKFHDYNFTETNKEICGGDEFLFFGNNLNATGVYRDSMIGSNGCDSVVLLNLSVVTEFVVDTVTTLCIGDTFIIDTEKFFSTGLHSHTFPSTLGCDSTVNLNLTIIEPIRNDISEIICFGDSFQLGEEYYHETGEYVDTLNSAIGCDSIVSLELIIRPQNGSSTTETICFGDSILSSGRYYKADGIYRDTVPDRFMCDSIVTLDLSIREENRTAISDEICFGQSISVGDSTYNTSGTYETVLVDISGCDSTVILDLVIMDQVVSNVDSTICRGDSILIGDQYFIEVGNYNVVIFREGLCDSTVMVDLNVTEPVTVDLPVRLCAGEPYTFGSATYTTEGIYRDTFQSVVTGCDSIMVLDLKYDPTYLIERFEFKCSGDSSFFDNRWIKETGIYDDTSRTVTNCDSIERLHLTFLSLDDPVMISESRCFGDSLLFDGIFLKEDGIYRDTLLSAEFCDSLVILDLSFREEQRFVEPMTICLGDTASFEGDLFVESGNYSFTYPDQFGCDSTIALDLIVEVCPIKLVLLNQSSPTCNGLFDGFVEFTLDYGQLQYFVRLLIDGIIVNSMSVSLPNQIGGFQNLGAGDYQLEVFSNSNMNATGTPIIVDFSLSISSDINLLNRTISDYNGFGVSCNNAADGNISFGIDGGERPYEISWIDGPTDSIRTGLAAADYQVTITDSRGCLDSFEFIITEPQPITFEIDSSPPSCAGEEDGGIQFINVQGGSGGYEYNVGFGGQSSAAFNNLGSDTYILSVEDNNGCTADGMETIDDPAIFAINLGDDITLENIGETQLHLSSNGQASTIEWTPSENLSCSDCPNPIANITNTITYTVMVDSESGCSAEDKITVILDIDRTVDPAQAFTPNGDGVNDVFVVHGNSSIAEVSNIEIYARSGELVWKQESFPINDPNFGWDGTYQGEPMTSQILGYFVEVIYTDGKIKVFKGQLTLIR